MNLSSKHQVYWDSDPSRQNVLRIVLEHAASWDNFSAMLEEAAASLEDRSGRYDVIVEPRSLIPSGNALPHLQQGRKLLAKNPNMGLLIIVVPTVAMLLVHTLQTTMERLNINMQQTRFVNSLEAATELILNNRLRYVKPTNQEEKVPSTLVEQPANEHEQEI